MNLRPVFYFIAGFILCLLWQKCGGQSKPSYIVKEEVVTVTVETVDSVKYPEYIKVPEPKYITEVQTVHLDDQKTIDSLIRVHEKEIHDMVVEKQKLVDQLYASKPGDKIFKDHEIKVYIDSVMKERYKMNWQIGVADNELKNFDYNVTVFSTETTNKTTTKARNGFGAVFGVATPWAQIPLIPGTKPTGMNADAIIGISYQRDWMNMQLSMMPNNEAIMFQVNPKIIW